MHLFADQPSSNNGTSFEWHTNDERDSSLGHKKHAKNDIRSGDPLFYTKCSDNVHCWGDAPRRKTRLLDVFMNGNGGDHSCKTMATNNTTNCQKLKARKQTWDSINCNIKSSPAQKQVGYYSSPTHTGLESSAARFQDKAPSGRERLLEWLRASQAKRDENNRQVFTRWVDRVEGMTVQEPFPSGVTGIPSGLKATQTVNFNVPASILPPSNPTGFPGVLSTPTFLVGNPMTVFPNCGVTQASLSRPQHTFQNSLPTVLSCKPQLANNCPAACGVLPQLVPLAASTCNFDTHCELNSVTPDHTRPEILSQTNTNAQNCTSGLTNHQPDSHTDLQTSPYNNELGVHQRINCDAYPGTTTQAYCDSVEHNIFTGQNLMPFAVQPYPYYLTVPANSELYYPYCYYRNQIPGQLADMTFTEGSQIDSQSATKPPGTPPLSVCYIQAPGNSSSQYPGVAHQIFVTEGGPMYMPSLPINPGSTLPCDQTNNLAISSTAFTGQDDDFGSNEPFSCREGDGMVDRQQNTSISSANGSVYACESSPVCGGANESNPIEDDVKGGALDFDMRKWYSVLEGIKVTAQPGVSRDRAVHTGAIRPQDHKNFEMKSIASDSQLTVAEAE